MIVLLAYGNQTEIPCKRSEQDIHSNRATTLILVGPSKPNRCLVCARPTFPKGFKECLSRRGNRPVGFWSGRRRGHWHEPPRNSLVMSRSFWVKSPCSQASASILMSCCIISTPFTLQVAGECTFRSFGRICSNQNLETQRTPQQLFSFSLPSLLACAKRDRFLGIQKARPPSSEMVKITSG